MSFRIKIVIQWLVDLTNGFWFFVFAVKFSFAAVYILSQNNSSIIAPFLSEFLLLTSFENLIKEVIFGLFALTGDLCGCISFDTICKEFEKI